MLSVPPSSFRGALLVLAPAGAEPGWAALKSSDRAKLGLLLRRSSSSSAACSDKEQLWHYTRYDGLLHDMCLTFKHSILIIATNRSKATLLNSERNVYRLERAFEDKVIAWHLRTHKAIAAARYLKCNSTSRGHCGPLSCPGQSFCADCTYSKKT